MRQEINIHIYVRDKKNDALPASSPKLFTKRARELTTAQTAAVTVKPSCVPPVAIASKDMKTNNAPTLRARNPIEGSPAVG